MSSLPVLSWAEDNRAGYAEVLGRVPDEYVRVALDGAVPAAARGTGHRSPRDLVMMFRWDATPQGGPYWAKVYCWMSGVGSKPCQVG